MEVCSNKIHLAIHLVEWDNNLEYHSKTHRNKLAKFLEVDK